MAHQLLCAENLRTCLSPPFKREVTNLEEEKRSLISVIKLLQVDAQQLEQKSRVIESNADKVTDRSKQKTFDYANEMKINNIVEILIDANDNNLDHCSFVLPPWLDHSYLEFNTVVALFRCTV